VFQRHGIDVTEQSMEKTGLIAVAGALKEIRRGTIAPGSRVLCCVTSGAMRSDGRAVPDARIPRDRTNLRAGGGGKR
jgi:hypothetical protein